MHSDKILKGKILFIVPNLYQDDNHFPLGPAYLASILRLAGHEVQIYSQDIFHQSNEELAEFLDNSNFDVIGLGFLAARYVETIRPLAKVINKHKKRAKFLLGGQGATPIPEYVLKDTMADIVVLGEGEKIVAPLIDDILNEKNLNEREGIAFRVGNNVLVNKRTIPIMNLDDIPFPSWDIFPIEKYANCIRPVGADPTNKTFPVITSRGCINRCHFCYRMERGIRLRSVENIFEELKMLNARYDITYFHFRDEMFIPNKKRIEEFASMLGKLKVPVKYDCMARVELAKDKEILKILRDSGCKFLNLGLESLDQEVLNLMGKNVAVKDNYNAVENTIEMGIHPGLNFIWGNPGDSKKSLINIVKFLIKYDTLGQIRTIRPPTPFPGSPLYYQAIQEKKLIGPADFFDKFKNSDRLTINFTEMNDKEVYQQLLEANTALIQNHFNKRTRLFNENKEECELRAVKMIKLFERLYFPQTPEDLRFRGARHYSKNVAR